MDEFGKVSLLRHLKESRYALFSKYVIKPLQYGKPGGVKKAE